MVLIARAMASEPEVLVLDEPESNLDFRNQLVVLDTISELASRGVACIFNTHYPAHALQRADRSLLLTKGGMSIYGPTKYVVSEDDIRSIFGVNAVIGDFEAEDSTVQSVIPVSISK
jgi:iron complex transport system ATP-binding protein